MSNTKSAESTLSEPIFNRQALVRLILPLLAEQFLSVSMGFFMIFISWPSCVRKMRLSAIIYLPVYCWKKMSWRFMRIFVSIIPKEF